MEFFQELVFTISFSLVLSLFIAKLFAIVSSCDDGNSTVSISVEEKIEKEWVVCDSEKEEKSGYFEDQVKVIEDVVCGYVEAELGSGVVFEDPKSVGGVGAYQVFDESPERTEIKDAGIGDEVFDDDWQGIETTELEKRFGSAVVFIGSENNGDRVNMIDNEVKIQLYGLHRVAIEGSCFEQQPMALKVSARANWNAWKRLENLGREDAMEQYIALLSQHVPDWM